MDSRDAILRYEILLDENGDLVNQAIRENSYENLLNLIKHGAKIHSSFISTAVRLKHWDCAELLINHAGRYTIAKSGDTLILAAKLNETQIVKCLLDRAIQLRKEERDFCAGSILIYKYPDKYLRDIDNKYTALHWAAHHNNHQMCDLFLMFPLMFPYSFYTALDANKKTAFELALELNHNNCVKSLAKGMPFTYAIKYFKIETLTKVCIDNITFGGLKNEYAYPSNGCPFIGHESIHKAQKKIFGYILALPKIEKEKALNSLFGETTMLYALYKLGYDTHLKKYQLLAGAELKKMHTHTKAQELNATIEATIIEPSITESAITESTTIESITMLSLNKTLESSRAETLDETIESRAHELSETIESSTEGKKHASTKGKTSMNFFKWSHSSANTHKANTSTPQAKLQGDNPDLQSQYSKRL